MTYQTYEFTAFSEASLLAQGGNGSSIGCGDTFTMPGEADTCFSVSDNDAFLSGDSQCNENSDDGHGQHASIMVGDAEAGNGGQIYAEVYHWVHDQHGNWYVMIEVEQEGSGEDYFTFYTGHGYEVPAAGAELTVNSSCNVTSSWIDFKCLDAGEKAEVEGPWVFDEDACTYTIQAEDLDLHNFKVVEGSQAEGGELVKISGNDGELTTEFGGTSGVYNLTLSIQDETDGASKLKVYVNGEYQDMIKLDMQSNGGGSNNGGFTDFTLNGLEIAEGDTVEIRAWQDCGEYVRIDALTFEQVKFEECDNPDAVKLDFEGFNAGDVLSGQIEGVTITAMGGSNEAMIFDSQNPTGGDGDLETQVAELGNVLIVSEDGDSSDPDDVVGGKITFEFDTPSDVFDLKVIDTEEGGTITLTLADGSTQTFDIPELVNGGVGQVVMDVADVVRMDVQLDGSGAIDDLCYVPGDPATGAISGTVFCDVGCDGIDGQVTIVPGDSYTIEAEDMHETGFRTVHGNQASGGELIKLNCAGDDGKVFTDFQGNSGTYDLKLRIQDESDGQSTIKLLIDGHFVDAVRLDGDNNGAGSDNGGFSTFVIEDVNIGHGDEIKLVVNGDAGEFVRIDKIDLIGEGNTTVVSEPVKEGVTIKLVDLDGNVVATTETDANGNYNFDDVLVGDYRVMGVAPDGTEFTIKDAGDDDTIDSDVDENGLSDVITVTADSETDIDLGVCEVKVGSLSGRYFLDTDRDDVDDGQATDPGIEGVVATLFDADGNQVGSPIETGPEGEYSFEDLEPGDYTVVFTDPNNVLDGTELVADNVGGDDAIDSDAIGDTTLSTIEAIPVVAGENTPDNDAGVAVPLGSLSGRYFLDNDSDGLDNDGTDNGVAGVTVELLDAAGNGLGIFETTDANGNYSFGDLEPGVYGVKFTDSVTGDPLTTTNVDGDASDGIDSDATDIGGGMSVITGISVVANENTPDNDAGVVPNQAPTATDAEAGGCADDLITVDLASNFADTDSASVAITMLGDENIADGETIVLDGVDSNGNAFSGLEVTRTGDTFSFDGEAAFAALNIGEKATASFDFKVEDSDGGVAVATLDVEFCGDANDYESLADSFPADGTYTVASGLRTDPFEEFAYSVKLDGTGDSRFDGEVFETAYCLSFFDPVNSAATHEAANSNGGLLLSAEGSNPNGVFNPSQVGQANGQSASDNLDLVKYIVSQNLEESGTYTGWEVQFAIWELTDNIEADGFEGLIPGVNGDNVDVIVADAIANGEGFEFGAEGFVGAIIDPNPSLSTNSQPFIIGFEFDAYDCLC